MLFKHLVLLLLFTAICAQKGGRQTSASEGSPSVQRSPSHRVLSSTRKSSQPSEDVQQVQEPDRDVDEDSVVVAAAKPTRRPARPSQPQPQRPPPSRPQAPEEGEGEGHEPKPEPYSFSYSVDDPETGAASSREESQDANGEITGYYDIKDKDGRTRRVEYTAGKDGFKATIKSNEEGLNSRAPADVNIELSESPSERIQSYAPNNRPLASETSIKGFGRPIGAGERFFQRLVPLPAPASPVATQLRPAEPTSDDSRISQTFDTQQRNTDEDEDAPQESAPVKGRPFVAQPARPVVIARQRPIGTFAPQRVQSFRERGGVTGAQQLFEPQVRQEVPNSIQDIQQSVQTSQPLITPAVGTKTASVRTLPAVRPVSPLLGAASPQFAIPTPGVQPVFTQYFTRGNGQDIELQPQSAPLSPPSNNLVWAQQQREPIAQQQLLDFFHPTQQTTPQQPLVFEAPATRPIQLFSSLDNSGLSYFPEQQPQQQLREHQPQPFGGYTLVLQHREAGQQRQVSAPQTPSEPQIIEQEKVSEERTESQEQQLRPIAAQQTVLPTVPLRQTIEYRPLPVLQRQEPLVFEPQVYENVQQYEPLQQSPESAADQQSAEESRASAPVETCECARQQSQRVEAVKGQSSAPNAAVKGTHISPARNLNAFLPHAYRN